MRRILSTLLVGAAGLLAYAPAGHAQTFLSPAGGITVKDLHVRTDGWVLVTFVEPISELSNCGTWATGPISYSPFMFLDMTGTAGGRQVYASLLAAQLTGRKLVSVGVSIGGPQACYLMHVRLAQ